MKEGLIILGVFVVDDILVVLVLSFSLFFFIGEVFSNVFLLFVLIEQFVYFVFIFLLVKWIVFFLFLFVEKVYVNFFIIIVLLVICLGMFYVVDFVGFSFVIGVFFVGIVVSQIKVKEEVYYNVEVLGYVVFILVFFVSVGLEVDFFDFGEQFFFIFILMFVVILIKLFGGYFGVQIVGFF